MKRSTARWSTAMAAAALCILPATGWAQTSTTPAQQPSTSATADQHDTQQTGSAQEHLREAKQALNEIPTSSVTGQARTQLTELKRHMTVLERSAASNTNESATAASSRSSRTARNARGNANWGTEVAAMDRILSQMLGSQAGASSAPAGETSATGTSGTAGASTARPGAAAMNLDEATRAKLSEVRTHITAFAAAMSGSASQTAAAQDQGAKSSTDPSASANTSGAVGTSGNASANPSTAAAPGSMTPGSPTPAQEPTSPAATQTGQAGTTGEQMGQSQTAPAAQGQADPTVAKRHLTEARDALSQLTQLPAAAQLTGETRTQISQLISNFNELITTDAGDWHPAYGKVVANLNALIGAQQSDESATPAAGTAGAVGTSGTATGSLDPAIRAKLVEFRTHLTEFERAAGGGASSSSSSAAPSASPSSSSSAAGMTSGSAASSASPSSTTSPSSTPSSTSSATTAPSGSTTGSTVQQSPSGSTAGQASANAPAASEAAGHDEAMRHIEAIEAILSGQSPSATSSSATGSSATGTTGSTSSATSPRSGSTAGSAATGANASLNSTQIEQIRMHVSELRRLLSQADKK